MLAPDPQWNPLSGAGSYAAMRTAELALAADPTNNPKSVDFCGLLENCHDEEGKSFPPV